MEIELNPEQRLLQTSIRDLLSKQTDFARVRALEAAGSFDESLWAQLASLGWLGMMDQRTEGDDSLVGLGILAEELARRAAIVPICETMAAAATLAGTGHPLCEAVASGTAIVVPTTTVPWAGQDSHSFATVDYGQYATHFLVPLQSDTALQLGLVAYDPRMCSRAQLRSISRTPIAKVSLGLASVEVVGGEKEAKFLVNLMRCLAAVQCVGYAEEALARSVDYAGMRVQFGRPIGTFQAVQHHCANMAIMVSSARFLTFEALWKLSTGVATSEEIALAKSWSGTAAVETTMLAHQIHGGVGFTEEYDLHFFSRRAKDRSIAWGTPDAMLELVGANLSAVPICL